MPTPQGWQTWTKWRKPFTTLSGLTESTRDENFEIDPEQAIGLLDLTVGGQTPAMQAEAEQVDVQAKASAEKLKRSRRPSLNYLGHPHWKHTSIKEMGKPLAELRMVATSALKEHSFDQQADGRVTTSTRSSNTWPRSLVF